MLDFATYEPVAEVTRLGGKRTAYWVQSMCSILVEDSRFSYAGNVPGAGQLPALRRRFFGGWIVMDGDSKVFVPNPLSNEIAKISLEQGVPAQVIVDRLMTGWRPEDDCEDIGQLFGRDTSPQHAKADEARETIFFIGFPSSVSAARARQKLVGRGFSAEHERGSDSLAIKRPWKKGDSLDSMDLLELELLALTRDFGGEISGRETSV